MTKLQKVEEYIRDKCPETMELSFGCKLVDNNGQEIIISRSENSGDGGHNWLLTTGKQVFVRSYYTHHEKLYKSGYIYENSFQTKKWRILGHELNILHAVRAVNAAEEVKRKNGEVFHRILIDGNGWLIRNDPSISSYIRLAKADLTKPLHLQDKELIDLLFNIFYPDENER